MFQVDENLNSVILCPYLIIFLIEKYRVYTFSNRQSFTSIVGPNGSGKSNVIDSMLFVFGYRANKIRSKKISVLIHSSETHQNIDSCTVSVHFQKIIDEGVSRISNLFFVDFHHLLIRPKKY